MPGVTLMANSRAILRHGVELRNGGWGGIRTHETLAGLPVFKTGAFNRSATHPRTPSATASLHRLTQTRQGRNLPLAGDGAADPADTVGIECWQRQSNWPETITKRQACPPLRYCTDCTQADFCMMQAINSPSLSQSMIDMPARSAKT